MDDFIDQKIKNALMNIERLKTPECPEFNTIGQYIEGKISEGERIKLQKHIESCLFCVQQVNEVEEVLHYQKKDVLLSPRLSGKLKALLEAPETSPQTASRVKFREFLDSFVNWKMVAVGIASACVAIFATVNVIKNAMDVQVQPTINPNSFVNIKAIGEDGRTLNDFQGVIVNRRGLIASNLAPMAKASSVRITLKDGTTYNTNTVWPDENRDLAVMKINHEDLPSIPAEKIEEVSVGETVFLTDTSDNNRGKTRQAVISDFKYFPGRHKDGEIQYIQIASFSKTINKGALVDGSGKLVGLIISSEKNIKMAVPLNDMEGFIKRQKALPIAELKKTGFSPDALNFYIKGILARDAQKWDEAITNYKRAIQLNPNMEGAHIELGGVYYRKKLFDLEAKEYEEVLRINPENSDAVYSLAANLGTRGLYEPAIREYEMAIKLDPTDADSYFMLGQTYLAMGRKSDAMAIYPKLLELDPGEAGILKGISEKIGER